VSSERAVDAARAKDVALHRTLKQAEQRTAAETTCVLTTELPRCAALLRASRNERTG
jgi:hypothetical protein